MWQLIFILLNSFIISNILKIIIDATPSPKLGPRWPSFKNAEVWGLEGPLPALNTKRGRGAC
jgi:hypothetical protein